LRVRVVAVKDQPCRLTGMSVAAIILAAGGSRRLGRPKQLLEWEGETLLNRAIRIATEAGALPVLAVLGAQFDVIRASIQSRAVISVHNDRWRQGMGRSIETGMRALDVCAPDAGGVLLMSCDQPRLTIDHLRSLMTVAGSQDSPVITASSYAGISGVPAVFPRETFAGLHALRGDKGARSIIEQAPCPVVTLEFAGGEVDIDAPEDLANL
jgi:molybdenum cofactor cytidylyltransferase